MKNFEEFKKEIERRLNRGEDAESIINKAESEVEKRVRAIVIAETAPEKLIGRKWDKTFHNLCQFLSEIVGMDRGIADKTASILFYILDSESLTKLLNFVSMQHKK